MEIIDFKEGDEFKIFELFEITFGRPMNSEYWYWRFQNNPAGKHMIKLMWSDEKLVGHYAVSPVEMSVNGEQVLGALSMTTMTHPDYGRRGIFGSLADALYEDLESNKNTQLIWGFPNHNSHYGFIKKMKWNDLGIVSHLIKDASALESVKSSNIQLSKAFSIEHENIMNSITADFKVNVTKSVAYLNWRFKDNPNVNYFTFNYIENNTVIAFLIVKEYPSEKAGVNNIFIVENGIPLEKNDLFPCFLSHIKEYLSTSIETFNIWLPLFDSRHIYLEKNGFLIGGKPTFLAARAEANNQDVIKDFRNWYFSYSDSDVY